MIFARHTPPSPKAIPIPSKKIESLLAQIPPAMDKLKTLVQARVKDMTPETRTAFVSILQEEVAHILGGQSDVEIKIMAILRDTPAANDNQFQIQA